MTGVRLLLHDFLDSSRRCKCLPPFGLLVHRRFDLKLAVEIMLGRVDGDAPAESLRTKSLLVMFVVNVASC